LSLPLQPQPPRVAAPKDPTTASLAELVQELKEVQRQKAELQQQEEKLTTEIRARIVKEKKVQEQVLHLLDGLKGESPKNNGARHPDINVDDESPKNNGIQKQPGEKQGGDNVPK
jgi:hypothetical protein